MTERQHSVVAMILVIMGLYIMRIAAVEVQPLTEGDIALRAEAIVSSSVWLDPSEHTVGGLSSAASPPLPSWLSALGMLLLGPTEIGLRLLSLLAITGTLALVYLIAQRRMSHRHAMLATATVGLSMPMITLGRQMTPEVIATCMLMLCWWSVLKLREASAARTQLLFGLAAGVALAGTLLSVTYLGVVALGLLVPLVIRRTTLPYGVAALLFGLILAGPWYAVMFSNHGTDFILAQSVANSVSVLRQGGLSGGPLDVIFALVLASPLLIASLVWVPVALRYRELLPERDDIVQVTAGLWFVALVMITAIGRQPITAAVIPILPVASVLSLAALDSAMQRRSPGVLLAFLGCMAAATVGALLVHARVVTNLFMLVFVVGAALGMLLLLVAAAGSSRRRSLAVRATRPVLYSALAVTAIAAILTIVIGNQATIGGGRKVALRLLEDTAYARQFVYLHHGAVAGASINSQLAWYTRGWMSHRNPRYDFTPLVMPQNDIDAAVVRAAIGAPWIVYCHLGASKEQISRVEEILDANYVVDEDTKHYLLFERRLRVTRQP